MQGDNREDDNPKAHLDHETSRQQAGRQRQAIGRARAGDRRIAGKGLHHRQVPWCWYTVKASMGHVRDLPKSTLGVDVDDNFNPTHLVPRDKAKLIKELKASVQGAREIYLATDPDREGEAIAWHLVQATGADSKPVHRVVFHEITPEAVKAAMASPRAIDLDLVDAQQARRGSWTGWWATRSAQAEEGEARLIRRTRRRRHCASWLSVSARSQPLNRLEYWSLEADLASRPAVNQRRRISSGLL